MAGCPKATSHNLSQCWLISVLPYDIIMSWYKTKWPPCCRQQFQVHILEWKMMYFDSNITKICSQGPNLQATSICSDNGLAPNWCQAIITLRPRQNGRHFADDTFKCIFLNENVRISIKISLKFVPKVPIDNIPALVQIMAWRRPGDKPLSEPMMDNLPTHICVTRPQWVIWSNGDLVYLPMHRCITCHWLVKFFAQFLSLKFPDLDFSLTISF